MSRARLSVLATQSTGRISLAPRTSDGIAADRVPEQPCAGQVALIGVAARHRGFRASRGLGISARELSGGVGEGVVAFQVQHNGIARQHQGPRASHLGTGQDHAAHVMRVDGERSRSPDFVCAGVVGLEPGGGILVFLILGQLIDDLLGLAGLCLGLGLLLGARLPGCVGQRSAVLSPRGQARHDKQRKRATIIAD